MSNQNKAIFSLIYQMQSADDQINIKELSFMRDITQMLSLSSQDIDEVSSNPMAYELSPPPPEQERMQILYMLLFAMRIDGEIHKKEETLAYKFGLKLGFHQIMLKDLINELKKHLNTRLPNDALLKIIRKYLN